MNKKYLKVVVPTVLLLPVALFVVLSVRGSLPETHPLMKIYAKKATSVKTIPMTDLQRSQAGGSEATFLLKNMFNNPVEYPSIPLIQKAGALLGEIPKTLPETIGQADFAISGTGIKTFYKLQYKQGAGPAVNIVAIPQLRSSKMGQIPNPKNWLKPNDFGYPGKYPYYFPLVIRKTPYGDIIYRVYVSNENPQINQIMQIYMNSKGLRPLQ